MKKKLPPTLQKYVDHIHTSGRPLSFTEVVSVTPRANKFRLLRQRGLIRNVTPGYKDGEEYTGPRQALYSLTDAGLECVSKTEYPEHERMKAVLAEAQAQGDFLEWLQLEQIHLCKFDRDGVEYHSVGSNIESLLAQYHGIGLEKIDAEKKQMRRRNRCSMNSGRGRQNESRNRYRRLPRRHERDG